MFNDAYFRLAFTLSLSLHLFAMSAGGFFHKNPLPESAPEVEVTYILQEENKIDLTEKIIENLPREYDLQREELKEVSGHTNAALEKIIEDVLPIKEDNYLKEKELKSLEEYIQYYELLREKIKKMTSQYCSNLIERGEVTVSFVLGQNGALKQVVIDKAGSSKSAQLQNAALKSIKAAAPFPAFPASLQREELTFNISIIFKK